MKKTFPVTLLLRHANLNHIIFENDVVNKENPEKRKKNPILTMYEDYASQE